MQDTEPDISDLDDFFNDLPLTRDMNSALTQRLLRHASNNDVGNQSEDVWRNDGEEPSSSAFTLHSSHLVLASNAFAPSSSTAASGATPRDVSRLFSLASNNEVGNESKDLIEDALRNYDQLRNVLKTKSKKVVDREEIVDVFFYRPEAKSQKRQKKSGKKRAIETEASEEEASEEEDEDKTGFPFALSGMTSGTVDMLDDWVSESECLGLLKVSGKKPKPTSSPIPYEISCWTLVRLGLKARANLRRERNGKVEIVRTLRSREDLNECEPKIWLVRAVKEKSSVVYSHVEVTDSLVLRGEDVRTELEQLKEAVRTLQRLHAQQAEVDAAAESGGGNDDPIERSGADYAEWMAKVDPEEEILPGHVVFSHGSKVSKKMPEGDVPLLIFVVSTHAAIIGNRPVDALTRERSVRVAYVGQAPVRIVGDVKEKWWLVPSGNEDGKARAISKKELQTNPWLCSQCFAVAWESTDVLGESAVTAFLNVHVKPCPVSLVMEKHEAHALQPFGEWWSSQLPTDPRPECQPLRSYQDEAVRQIERENTIISLPTGAGKTLIAVHAVAASRARHQSSSATAALFLVPTRSLVEQQAEVFRKQSQPPATVVEILGDRADNWTTAQWSRCVASCDVIVGTPEVFRRAIITQGRLTLSQFHMIVFDECHHAVGNSPMAAIMKDVYLPAVKASCSVPRVVGLTASIINGSLDGKEAKRQELETLFQAQVFAPEVGSSSAVFHRVEYERQDDDLDEIASFVEGKIQHLVDGFMSETGVAVKHVKKAASHAAYVLKELGMQAFIFLLSESYVHQLKQKADELSTKGDEESQLSGKRMAAGLQSFRATFREQAQEFKSADALQRAPYTTNKVKELVKLLCQLLQSHLPSDPHFKGIVFVDQVALAFPLAHVLEGELKKDIPLVCIMAVSGTGSMSDSQRRKALEDFKSGRVQVLVATEALQEGVDVAACAFVVRFSQIRTTKAHIQGAGRARRGGALVFYFENDPENEITNALSLDACAKDPTLALTKEERRERIQQCNEENVYPFIISEGAGTITLYNAEEIVSEYFAKAYRQNVDIHIFWKVSASKRLEAFRYPVPPRGFHVITCDDVTRYWGDRSPEMFWDSSRTKNLTADQRQKRWFLFVVAVHMSRRGVIGPSNRPNMAIINQIEDAPGGSIMWSGVCLRETFPADVFRWESPPTPGVSSSQSRPAASSPRLQFQNYKGTLLETVAKSSTTVKFSTQRLEGTPDHKPSFQATVTLGVGKHTCEVRGQPADSKKEAEQLAAKEAIEMKVLDDLMARSRIG